MFLLVCFCVPSLPLLSHSFSTDFFSVTGAQGCCHGGLRGWGAGREGHWGGLPPRAGVYMCSLGGRALGT